MSTRAFDAVIFDLDGVITKTALVHSSAWKSMFDDYLHEREEKYNEAFKEFSHEQDYLKFVDGKPRYNGVQSFLESRGIKLSWGDPSDGPEKETVCGIGNRKNIAFNQILDRDGVEVYESTHQLINTLKKKGIRVGVASSSKNCEGVLEAAGLLKLMETRVDGVVSVELGLNGKPEPDIFTTAANNLGVSYDRAVVVEDAESGVRAGKKGNFGLVLGIARENNVQELYRNGADIVVEDIDEIGFEGIENWFKQGRSKDSWQISYYDYDPEKEKSRESLLTIGNGYFGTRGAMEESSAGKFNYPGTYMAGVYNRLVSDIGGRDVENEDFVNVINWTPVSFKIDEDDWIDINKVEILEIKRTMHFDNGVMYRKMILKDNKGRRTRIDSRRIAAMDNPHLAAIEYAITPLNYAGKISVRSGLYGNHINAGVERYKQLNQQHLKPLEQGGEDNMQFLKVATTQSAIEIAAAAKVNIEINFDKISKNTEIILDEAKSELVFEFDVLADCKLKIDKIVSLYKNTDPHIDNPAESAVNALEGYESFDDVLKLSEQYWDRIWDTIDVRVEGDRLAQKLLRMHLYHLMVTTSPHNKWIDFGIPARGLHGEAYRGHVFWDELYILPLYDVHLQDAARSVLMYRYRRLNEARKYATEYGYKGAMYPWQSGSDGREETQVVHLNPVSGEWGEDYSSLQRHVSLAIAFNSWQYFWISGDTDFMVSYGAEMFFEICRFWASKCDFDEATGRYSIDKVMGPDEFHEKYKNAGHGGLKDNAYTNIMVAWMFEKALRIAEILENNNGNEVNEKIGLSTEELAQWDDIAGKLRIVTNDEGIISQYDGYFDLKELDWDAYREKYGNIYRMDRILKAEGKSTDDYKVAKQADTLMAFYNLDKTEVDGIFNKLNYDLPADYLQKNLKYYLQRTSHGSTLSRVVHAQLANMIGDTELSWDLYLDALTSDFQDIQGGTTGEGIHAGVMAGTVWIALTTFGGLDLKKETVEFKPKLPSHWQSISFRFSFREDDYECEVKQDIIRLKVDSETKERIEIKIGDLMLHSVTGKWSEFQY